MLSGDIQPKALIQEFVLLSADQLIQPGPLDPSVILSGRVIEAIAREVLRICERISLESYLLTPETRILLFQAAITRISPKHVKSFIGVDDIQVEGLGADRIILAGHTQYFDSQTWQARNLDTRIEVESTTDLREHHFKSFGISVSSVTPPPILGRTQTEMQLVINALTFFHQLLVGKCCSSQEAKILAETNAAGYIVISPSSAVRKYLSRVRLPDIITSPELFPKIIEAIEAEFVSSGPASKALEMGCRLFLFHFVDDDAGFDAGIQPGRPMSDEERATY